MNTVILLWILACSNSGSVKLEREQSSEPTDTAISEPSQPSSEPSQPSSEPSQPSSEPSQPSSEPSQPSSEPQGNEKTWSGSREVVFPLDSYCTEDQTETGIEITTQADVGVFFDACAECEEIYEVTLTPDYICYNTVYFGSTVYYGLSEIGDQRKIYAFYQDNSGVIFSLELVTTDFDTQQNTGSYSYDGEYPYGQYAYPFTVTGTFTLSE